MYSPPEEACRKNMDVEFVRKGMFNCVVFWMDIHLDEHTTISTSFEAVHQGLKWHRPAIQYLPGEMRVDEVRTTYRISINPSSRPS